MPLLKTVHVVHPLDHERRFIPLRLYIDHRASALPLVEAMESLPGLVKIHVLSPPTLPALREELDRARGEKKPYHVVHFDGHGVYDRKVGLGGLCFEHPEDIRKLEKRRHVTVFTQDSIVAGSRDRSIADAPELDYSMAAEILFLIETLEKPR